MSSQQARLQVDRGPGSGPTLTGVSARGSSARGWSRWALPWRQLEHLQVPLLRLGCRRPEACRARRQVWRSPRPKTQGRPEDSSKVPFPFTGRKRAQAGGGQSLTGRTCLASLQEGQGHPLFTLGGGPPLLGQCCPVCFSEEPRECPTLTPAAACAWLSGAGSAGGAALRWGVCTLGPTTFHKGGGAQQKGGGQGQEGRGQKNDRPSVSVGWTLNNDLGPTPHLSAEASEA